MRRARLSAVFMVIITSVLFIFPVWAGSTSSLPSTIMVNNNEDSISEDGFCTLREAITSANTDAPSGSSVGECSAGNGNDTILIPAGVYTLSITGAWEDSNLTGDLDITSNLTLIGAGSSSTTLTASEIDRPLHVLADVTVEIEGLTLTGGHAPDSTIATPNAEAGGGIMNQGILTVTDSIITGNQAGNGTTLLDGWGTAGEGGGGVYNAGTLTLLGTTINNNRAGDGGNGGTASGPPSGGDGGSGGGIFNMGSLLLRDSDIQANQTGVGGLEGLDPGIPAIGQRGRTGNGGGIYNSGSALLFYSSITSNSSPENRSTGGHGGGVYNSGNISIYYSGIMSNTAGIGDDGGGGFAPPPTDGGDGGGIYSESGGDVFLVSSAVVHNRAGDAGDCIADCSILTGDPSQAGRGGAVFAEGVLYVAVSTISSNNAGRGMDITEMDPPQTTTAGDGGDGGGLYAPTPLITDTTIAFNATGLGGVGPGADGFRGQGGGLYTGNAAIGNSIIGNNVSTLGTDCYGTLQSLGYLLVQNTNQCPITGDPFGVITGVDPLLAPLALNNSTTPNHALLPDSLARDAGTCFSNSADQRGFYRPVDLPGGTNTANGCDLGAIEEQLVLIVPVKLDVTEGGVSATYSVTLMLTPTASVLVTSLYHPQLFQTPTELTFTPLTWTEPQTITVIAVDDGDIEGSHTAFMNHNVNSTDPVYQGQASRVNVFITDNDFPTTPTPTHTPSPTFTPTATNTPFPPATPTTTNTPMPTLTVTASPTSTNTPVPTQTATVQASATPIVTPSATSTPSPTPPGMQTLYLPLILEE